MKSPRPRSLMFFGMYFMLSVMIVFASSIESEVEQALLEGSWGQVFELLVSKNVSPTDPLLKCYYGTHL